MLPWSGGSVRFISLSCLFQTHCAAVGAKRYQAAPSSKRRRTYAGDISTSNPCRHTLAIFSYLTLMGDIYTGSWHTVDVLIFACCLPNRQPLPANTYSFSRLQSCLLRDLPAYRSTPSLLPPRGDSRCNPLSFPNRLGRGGRVVPQAWGLRACLVLARDMASRCAAGPAVSGLLFLDTVAYFSHPHLPYFRPQVILSIFPCT